jgi:hypothetical protein
VKAELTEAEERELERLYISLANRARNINSIVTRSEIEMMHDQKLLPDMRFFAKHWGGGISMETVRAARDGAKLLNQEPMELITEEHLQSVQTFVQRARLGGVGYQYAQTLARVAAVIIPNTDRLDFIISLVIDRGIADPDEISQVLETAEESPRPLTGGVL